ncbi:MAG: hypothetical protein ACYSTT_24735 [Planctomycetota bacterium]|jgi:hypothetical protein
MKREAQNLCIISAISFIAGVAVIPLAVMVLGAVVGFYGSFFTNRQSEEQQAKAFFYRTMNAIFEDTYKAEEGSVSPEFMDTFKKYEPQLGKKCRLYIIDSTSGYYECLAFFPSGDVFRLVIALMDGGWILDGLYLDDWDITWRDAIRMSKNVKLED